MRLTTLWAVTPRSDKLDLAHVKGQPVAWFKNKELAQRFADQHWPGFADMTLHPVVLDA